MKTKLPLLLLCLIVAALMIILNSCTAITYRGKYANITGTPGGAVIITPKYAIDDAKGN